MASKKIILVRPNNIYNVNHYPPLGLILIATELEHIGYDVKIFINNNSTTFYSNVIKEAKDSLFIGITSTTSEIPDAIKIAKLLKENIVIPIVWGGWHTTLFPEQMEKSNLVDFAVVGEGESGIIETAHCIENKINRSKIIKNNFINLDNVQFPKYELVQNIESFIVKPLNDKFQEYYKKPLRWLPYESSRGCPFNCSFCINTVTNNRQYRVKSSKKVAFEIVELVKKFHLSHVKIIDDLFFAKLDRVIEIFEEIQKTGIQFTWDAECRVDLFRNRFIDEKILKFLKSVGLVQLTFGIESGSLDSLKRMNKGGMAGPEYAIKAVKMCAAFDIASRGSFVLDIPGDTKKDLFETVKLIRNLRKFPKFACGVHTFRPYPKSILCEQLINDGLFYQPNGLEEWADIKFIKQYTDTSTLRKWQKNWKISSNISFYESLESGFWLKPHQINNRYFRVLNEIFRKIAYVRNKLKFYCFPLDKIIYNSFKNFVCRSSKGTNK